MLHQKKLLLGIMTVWPLIFIPAFIIMMFAYMAGMIWLGETNASTTGLRGADPFTNPVLVVLAIVIGILHILTAINEILLFFIYVYHIMNNARLTDGQRISWVLLIIAASIFAMPIYFYLYIWRRSQAHQA